MARGGRRCRREARRRERWAQFMLGWLTERIEVSAGLALFSATVNGLGGFHDGPGEVIDLEAERVPWGRGRRPVVGTPYRASVFGVSPGVLEHERARAHEIDRQIFHAPSDFVFIPGRPIVHHLGWLVL